MNKKQTFFFISVLVLSLMLYTGPVLAHYCDDNYIGQKDRENCWWRYWNNQPSQQDLQYQAQETSTSQNLGGMAEGQSTGDNGVTTGSAHYCDNNYIGQKDRENCWWRYWNNQPSQQDLQYQAQGRSTFQGSESSIADRPTEGNVVTISFGPDSDSTPTVSINQDQHDAQTRNPSREEYERNRAWLNELDEDTNEADAIVINYPQDPTDQEDFENYRSAEQVVYDQGNPYTVCFPPRTVVVRRTTDGVETTETLSGYCVVVTPK